MAKGTRLQNVQKGPKAGLETEIQGKASKLATAGHQTQNCILQLPTPRIPSESSPKAKNPEVSKKKNQQKLKISENLKNPGVQNFFWTPGFLTSWQKQSRMQSRPKGPENRVQDRVAYVNSDLFFTYATLSWTLFSGPFGRACRRECFCLTFSGVQKKIELLDF